MEESGLEEGRAERWEGAGEEKEKKHLSLSLEIVLLLLLLCKRISSDSDSQISCGEMSAAHTIWPGPCETVRVCVCVRENEIESFTSLTDGQADGSRQLRS